mmetsp:Transcript_5396/g.15353  ORF Transcript_5396/g.15353 Transcript_5396/m.15353 type:complete len:201 (+) Transcript_5396:518-1120(+)
MLATTAATTSSSATTRPSTTSPTDPHQKNPSAFPRAFTAYLMASWTTIGPKSKMASAASSSSCPTLLSKTIPTTQRTTSFRLSLSLCAIRLRAEATARFPVFLTPKLSARFHRSVLRPSHWDLDLIARTARAAQPSFWCATMGPFASWRTRCARANLQQQFAATTPFFSIQMSPDRCPNRLLKVDCLRIQQVIPALSNDR